MMKTLAVLIAVPIAVPHSFPEKYPGDNAEKGSVKPYCSLISGRITTGFPQVLCSCQP
jgi:hypothetical protein